ncbi:tRNA (adenosine(37)-N6)-threonylcarbamoyltransferase complex ATPase subunit type 1 TsaE [Maribacter sp. R77961]|uniref:tRNA (adenosine(37)-N6)-threonylcarbamoyltransferase complex ATPase subunit type 1 TsaE n=1 Tax=Maribacter sp. R77961 TaxID=3093871 RepID=UPI0037C9F672
MQLKYEQYDIETIAKKIIQNTKSKIIAFYAPMGAGKTTLIKAILKELGSTDEVSSPTFGLVNEYHDTNGEVLAYHFDFYRLNDEMEALDMGIEEYFFSDRWIFMEWPEKIPNLLPGDVNTVKIEILDAKTRQISWD